MHKELDTTKITKLAIRYRLEILSKQKNELPSETPSQIKENIQQDIDNDITKLEKILLYPEIDFTSYDFYLFNIAVDFYNFLNVIKPKNLDDDSSLINAAISLLEGLIEYHTDTYPPQYFSKCNTINCGNEINLGHSDPMTNNRLERIYNSDSFAIKIKCNKCTFLKVIPSKEIYNIND